MSNPRWLPQGEAMPSNPEEWADLVGRLKNVSTIMAQQANDAGCNYEHARDTLTELIGSGQVTTGSLWANVVLAATQQRDSAVESRLYEFGGWLYANAGLIVLMQGEAGGLFVARLTNDPCKMVVDRSEVRIQLPTGERTFIRHHNERIDTMRIRPDYDRFCRFSQGQDGLWVLGERGALLVPFNGNPVPLSDEWRTLVAKFQEAESVTQPA